MSRGILTTNSILVVFAISCLLIPSSAIAGDARLEILDVVHQDYIHYKPADGGNGRNALFWARDIETEMTVPMLWSSCGGLEDLSKRFDEGERIASIRMSANGQTLAVLVDSDSPPTRRLYMLPSKGGTSRIALPEYTSINSLFGISADGSVLLIQITGGFHLWSAEGGLRQILVNNYPTSKGNPVLSPDGMSVVFEMEDEDDNEGFYVWSVDGLGFWVGMPFAQTHGLSLDEVSNGGQFVLGDVHNPDAYIKPFRWSMENGFEFLIDTTSFSEMSPFGTDAEQNVVIGECHTGLDCDLFIWTPDAGLRDLRTTLIEAYGLQEELEGWTLLDVSGISDDGNILLGRIYRADGLIRYYRIILDVDLVPASSDVDADGTCDEDDKCDGDDASGDYNGDGVCDDLDPPAEPEEPESNVDFELDGCPEDIVVIAVSPEGIQVDFPMPQLKPQTARRKMSASRTSGSVFPIGVTPVTIYVVDSVSDSGDVLEAVCTFNVEVRLETPDPSAVDVILPQGCFGMGAEAALFAPMMLVWARRRRRV